MTDEPKAKDQLIGQLVADRFLVMHLIGKGGVGRVYRACQVDLDRPIALKVLNEHMALDQEQILRFHREARTASKLNHPGCVTVYDFGEWNDKLFMAMELVSGRNLAQIIHAEFPFAPERIVSILSQVCDALDAAHQTGLLHRDLKPENILVSREHDGSERVKLADFGLAILLDTPAMERLTQDGSVFGTPAFMSPEQCRGVALDPRSDIYSLGAILYEMLADRVPFQADNPVDLMTKQMFVEPEPPSRVVNDLFVHPKLEALCLQALAKAPEDRPQSAARFGALLRAALGENEDPSQAHRIQLAPLTREDRAQRAGLPMPAPSTRMERPNIPLAPGIILVSPDRRQAITLMGLLASNEFVWKFSKSLPQTIEETARHEPLLILMDLGQDETEAHESLDALAAALSQSRILARLPVVVTGPDDDLSLMEQALSMGVFSYVPHKAAADRLVRILRKAQRRARKVWANDGIDIS